MLVNARALKLHLIGRNTGAHGGMDMEPSAFHIVMRPRNDRVIAPTLDERRLLARTLFDVCRSFELLGFGVPDNHLHLVAVETEVRAKELARRVAIAVTKRLGLPGGFAPAHLEPIHSSKHLQNALRYSIGQSEHHGASGDPDFEGTNLPDILGLRPMGGFTADRVRRWLPRLRCDEILSWARVDGLMPSDGPVTLLGRAARAALARPELDGSDRQLIAARRALVHLGEPTLGCAEIGRLLGVSARTVRRYRKEKLDQEWVRILRLQLAWLSRPGRVDRARGPFGADLRPFQGESAARGQVAP